MVRFRDTSLPMAADPRTPASEAPGGTFPAPPALDRKDLAAFDLIPQGVVVTRPSDGLFLYVNAAAAGVLGRPPEELVGRRRASELYERPERRSEVVQEVAEAGTPEEVALLRPDGRRVWVLLTLRQALFDGEPCLLCSVVDVTHRLGIEAELRQSQDRLAIVGAMARSIRAGLSRVRVAEVAVERTAEILSSELRVCCALLDELGEARVLASHGPPSMPSLEGRVVDLSLAPAYLEALVEGRPFVTEDALDDRRLADVRESLAPLGCRAFVDAPLFGGAELVGVFCIAAAEPRAFSQHEVETLREVASYLSGALHDAQLQEERREHEAFQRELLHADRLKSIGQLAAGVAHEINNPAAFVSANLDALRTAVRRASRQASDDGGPLDLREMGRILHECEVGLHRIASVASQLRAFARVERDELETTDLNGLVEGACAMVRNEVRARGTLVTELGNVPLVVACPGKISQVLVNLLVNAAHALPEGDVEANRIVVRTRRQGDQVTITVEDTGSGMDERVRARIFEPFYTTKPRELGTGLGLSLSAEIVRQHGGEIEVSSAPGQGSTFSVSLPIGQVRPSSLQGLAVPNVEAGRRRLRVLAVDDEELLLRSLERTLGRRHELVTALGGRAGLAAMEGDDRWDVVLCDLMMPDLDGQRLYETVARDRPQIARRFVFMSGGAFTPRTKEFVARVDRPVLHKPVRVQALETALARLVSSE